MHTRATLLSVYLLLRGASAIPNTLTTCAVGAVFLPGTTFYYSPTDTEAFNGGFGVINGPCTAGSVALVQVVAPNGAISNCDDLPLGSGVTDVYWQVKTFPGVLVGLTYRSPGVIRGTMAVGTWRFVFNIGFGSNYANYGVVHTQVTVEAPTPTATFTSTPTSFVTATSTNTIVNTETLLPAYVTSPSATAPITATISPSTTITVNSTIVYTRTRVSHTVTKITSTKIARCTKLSACPKKQKLARNPLKVFYPRDWTPSGPLTVTTTPAPVSTTVVASTFTSTDTVFVDSFTTTTVNPTPATVTIYSGIVTATITLPTSTKIIAFTTTSKATVTSTDVCTLTKVVTTTPLCTKKK